MPGPRSPTSRTHPAPGAWSTTTAVDPAGARAKLAHEVEPPPPRSTIPSHRECTAHRRALRSGPRRSPGGVTRPDGILGTDRPPGRRSGCRRRPSHLPHPPRSGGSLTERHHAPSDSADSERPQSFVGPSHHVSYPRLWRSCGLGQVVDCGRQSPGPPRATCIRPSSSRNGPGGTGGGRVTMSTPVRSGARHRRSARERWPVRPGSGRSALPCTSRCRRTGRPGLQLLVDEFGGCPVAEQDGALGVHRHARCPQQVHREVLERLPFGRVQ